MNKIVLLSVIFSLSLAFAEEPDTTSISTSAGTEEVSEPNKPEQIETEKAKEETHYGMRFNIGYAKASAPKTQFIDGGLGKGFGLFALMPFNNSTTYIVPEITLQQRVAIDTKGDFVLTLEEIAIEALWKYRFRYSEENLVYWGGGLLLGFVANSYYDEGNGEIRNKKREGLDFGFVGELGFRLDSTLSIDIRLTEGFASIGFVESEFFLDPTLWQLQIGLNLVAF